MAPEFQRVWDDALGCPTTTASADIGAHEFFERGEMVWLSTPDLIYTFSRPSQVWASYPDLWQEGNPWFTCSDAEAQGMPFRGFGRLWCDRAEVRQALGNAVRLETAVSLVTQRTSTGAIMLHVKNINSTYILLPTGVFERYGPPPPTTQIIPTATLVPTRVPTLPPATPTTMPTPTNTVIVPPSMTPTITEPPPPATPVPSETPIG